MVNLIPMLMFAVVTLLIFLRVPVAFSMLLTALIFGLALWGEATFNIILNAFWVVMNNFLYVAVPLFVLMSALLQECRLVDDMFKALYMWIGRYRGSLLIIAMILGFVIGAMTAVAAAGVVTLSILLFPMMMRYGYPLELSIGGILYAGTLPQLVPPSLNLAIYGVTVGVSIGQLFAGGLSMGLVMLVLGILYVVVWSWLNKDKMPVIATEEYRLREKILALKSFIGPVVIIVGTLGSIFAGIATPTEAAGVGSILTLMYALAARRLNLKTLTNALLTATKTTIMVFWIVVGSFAFGSVFTGAGGKEVFRALITSLPEAKVTALALAIALIFVLGMFLDTSAIIIVFGPLLSPIMHALGYDPVWWGTIFGTILLTAFLSPPVGLSLYYFMGIYRDIPPSKVFKAVWPFISLQVATAAVGIAFPDIITTFVKLLVAR